LTPRERAIGTGLCQQPDPGHELCFDCPWLDADFRNYERA